MNLIKLGAAALNQTPLDWDGNLDNILNVIKEAKSQDVNVLCLPELCITGYGCEDAFFMPSVLDKAWEQVLKIALVLKDCSENFIVAVGAPVPFGGCIYNCTVFITQVGILNIVPKKNLCSDGIHYESRWFKPWLFKDTPATNEATGDFRWKGPDSDYYQSAVFGDEPVEFNGLKIGAEICEDAWVADRPGINHSKLGVDIIVNPSASHFSFGKSKIRQRFVEEGSRALQCAYVYANLLGNESGRVIFDGDTYIANAGKIVSKGARFSFKNYTLTTAVVNLDKNKVAKYQNGSFKPSYVYSQEAPGDKYKFKKEFGNLNPIDKVSYGQHYDLDTDHDSFTRAVSLGLWDYMRKSRSKGFILSLSGGADSAAVACLVRSMVICAYNELGPDGLKDEMLKLGMTSPENKSPDSFIKEVIGEVLTCVYQGTNNSSDETERSAFSLASCIGARFYTIDVQPMVNNYKRVTQDMVGRDLSWKDDDIALQNIQARVRAPSVWMMANIKGALLLSTSNRSEAAVGYATMDGDTCGGLSPIAGVSKQFILEWLRGYATSDHEFGGLGQVLKLKPTAELRPQEDNQTDESDLMPYPILDKIEKMFVRDKMSPTDIYETLVADGVENALNYVEKFFTLFARNQWKRERYAPSFHLDDESLDPKTFFRFPILSAGFNQEIAAIRKSLMNKALR